MYWRAGEVYLGPVIYHLRQASKMNVTCEYCGEPAMPSDSKCWHCGKPLPNREVAENDVVTAATSWQSTGKSSAVIAYGIITLLVIVAAVIVMASLGSQPLLQIGVGTRTPEEWISILSADASFYVNLPEEWNRLDGANPDQLERLKSRLAEDDFLEKATLPFGDAVDDLEIVFIAAEEKKIGDLPASFLVIGNSPSLSALSYEEAIQYLSLGDYQVRETNIVENFDKSNLSIYVRTPLDDEAGGSLRCRQQFIHGERDSLLVSACAPDNLYRGQEAKLLTLMESFQRFSK